MYHPLHKSIVIFHLFVSAESTKAWIVNAWYLLAIIFQFDFSNNYKKYSLCMPLRLITHLNTLCKEEPAEDPEHWRPAKMPPATLPNEFDASEILDEGPLPLKPPDKGNISPQLDELILWGVRFKVFFGSCPVEFEIGALDTPLISAEVDTDGLIKAAIENKEVAWDDCLRLRNVVVVGAELSDVGLTDLLLQRKKYYFFKLLH